MTNVTLIALKTVAKGHHTKIRFGSWQHILIVVVCTIIAVAVIKYVIH